MAVRTLHAPRFSALFQAHLLRIAGGTAALALLASSGCTRTEQICVDESEGAVTLENTTQQWFCEGNIRFELKEVGESTPSSTAPLVCADGTYVAKTAQGAPCVASPATPFVVDGRPMTLDGTPRFAPLQPGDAWVIGNAGPALTVLTSLQRSILAAQWLRAAQYEHASVASFARFTLDLMRFGAPPHLLLAAQHAGADEVRHAELSFTLAQRFDPAAQQPANLDVGTQIALSPDLATFAADTFREGCFGETLAAVRAAERKAVATDAGIVSVLDVLIADEGAHAQLAWDTLEWALAQGGEPVAAAVREEADAMRVAMEASPAPAPHDPALIPFGVLPPAAEALALRAAWNGVIAPSLQALLGDVAPTRH